MGKNFSFATSSGNYWDMDKAPLVVNLGAGSQTVQVNFWMDGRGDWYGNKKIMEGSGHMKSLHLTPFIASVQRGPEALFIASATTKAVGYTRIESTFTLPASADYWVGQEHLKIASVDDDLFTSSPAADSPDTVLESFVENGVSTFHLVDKTSEKGVGVLKRVPVKAGNFYREAALLKGGNISLYLTWV